MRTINKTVSVAVALLCVAALLSGCWSRKELDDLAIQLATAIDKVGDEYRVATQVVIPSEVSSRISSAGISPVTLYHATAPTMIEAFRKLTETSSRKIYSAHIRVVVIGEALAKEGIAEVLDVFSRNPESRNDFYLMIARNGMAMDVLETLTSLERIPAENLFYSLDTSSKTWAPTTTVSIDEIINQLVAEGFNPVLTGVELVGNKERGKKLANVQEINPSSRAVFRGLAVFQGDKLAGWLNEEQSKGYNYIMNNVTNSAGHLRCPDGKLLGTEVLRNKTKLKAKVVAGKPVIVVHISHVTAVADVECQIDLSKPRTIDELEKQASEKMRTIIDQTIRHAQKKYKFDVFGFGQVMHEQQPRAWNAMREDWAAVYWPHLQVEYNINIQLSKIGSTKNSFINDIHK